MADRDDGWRVARAARFGGEKELDQFPASLQNAALKFSEIANHARPLLNITLPRLELVSSAVGASMRCPDRTGRIGCAISGLPAGRGAGPDGTGGVPRWPARGHGRSAVVRSASRPMDGGDGGEPGDRGPRRDPIPTTSVRGWQRAASGSADRTTTRLMMTTLLVTERILERTAGADSTGNAGHLGRSRGNRDRTNGRDE